jgi:integrase
MASQKLVATKIDRHKPVKDDEVLADGNGLYIRFRKQKDGKYSKTWMHTYKVGKSSVYMTLGEHNSQLTDFEVSTYRLQDLRARLTLETARKIVIELNTLRKKGIDPKAWFQNEIDRAKAAKESAALDLANKQKEEDAHANRLTVSTLFAQWFLGDPSNRKDGGAEIKRTFEKDVLPRIGHIAVEDVSKSTIMEVLDAVLGRGANRLANLMLADLRQMFEYAVDRELIETNPTARIRKERVGGKDVIRTRHLTEAEIVQLGKAIQTVEHISARTESAMWIMLSTLCRAGEMAQAKWESLNLEAGFWVIPPDDSKNGKPLTVVLSDFTKRHFKRLEELKTNDVWVFPHRHNPAKHQDEKYFTRNFRDNQCTQSTVHAVDGKRYTNKLVLPGGRWHSHDLRRTGATMMGNLGTRGEVIEKCLNHTEENRLKKTYQQQSLMKEQAEAWRVLGDRLDVLLGTCGDNILVLRQAAKVAA